MNQFMQMLNEKYSAPKVELLTEDWGSEGLDAPILMESTGSGSYLTGVFMQAEKRNGNGRIYPKRVLETAVDNYLKEHEGKLMLGELMHPPRANVDIMESCIVIEKLWWEGNNVMGRARILEGDGGNGDKLKSLIDAGWTPGVSSRGLGSLTESNGSKYVNPGFKITCIVDVVLTPSAPDAYLRVE